MASIQEPEVQFAQRLASNEKPIRTRAIKKLRKYINARSQKAAGGFTGDELLKLWKGLFYCLWMQDKPLLQEELSKQISSLIHSFQHVDGQFLFLESFLQTLKREWTGIDRLRMDKFFQLVRFMFRQTFEMLKRKNWDSSVVSSFLELLTAQLLQSSSGAPSGLQLHILDLYMTELAAVGSAELTADQNLIFIEPFCKTVSKTKDRILFSGICTSIFGTIIDQAPFAIDDLMREVNAAQASDSDSGQASEEEDEEEEVELSEKTTRKAADKKKTGKQINGNKSDEEDEDEDELLHLEEDSDTEGPCDEDIGPVLQFDYAGLADRLFGLASRSGTPGRNRQRLYRIIKVLRDLSEGIFPQDEYPEEVSTDEDDDMFGSRKRMKRTGGRGEDEEDGAPTSKKRKGKKKETSTLNKQDKDSAKDDSEPADSAVNNDNKKKKKKRKKKKKAGEGSESADKETEGSQAESAVSSVKVTDASSETLLLSEVKKPSVTVTEETSGTTPSTTDDKTSEVEPEPETSSHADATVSGKKKKKGKKAKLQTDETVAELQVVVEEESTAAGPEETTTPETETTTPAKKKKKNAQEEIQVNGVTTEQDGPEKPTDATTPGKKKSKKKSLKADEAVTVEAEAEVQVEGKTRDTEITSVVEEASQEAAAAPLKKKKKNKQEETTPTVEESVVTPLKKKKTKNNQKQPTEDVDGAAAAEEPPQLEDAGTLPVTVTSAKKKKNQADEINDEAEDDEKPAKRKKKRKIPVTFEYEADELEAAAAINGLAEEETKLEADEPSTPLSGKRSQKKKKKMATPGSEFITFQNNAAVPTPLFCKTKGSPSTPQTGKKKSQTPKSESKKVTFGLKNNKTAEFRKTDRSLLVSPDGSSRVPFDPQQKPKFGVLKSPVSTRVKKTPKKTAVSTAKSTAKSTPKRRPSAADFF
ncbi:ribosomal RNA processing protein 1 homolog B-like isoform X2 [Acanthopagrus latus]|uniref:ribosomal RNA processing protein 1 homolog B-like isoform X2 n=1 Tax=Acanthopagrus latus TaxID=8177 RepID=UPI00187BD703|nr:ribosomal RNA processing protein 1 homolog B-like isoform X2 [Acanthopagrus latus]